MLFIIFLPMLFTHAVYNFFYNNKKTRKQHSSIYNLIIHMNND